MNDGEPVTSTKPPAGGPGPGTSNEQPGITGPEHLRQHAKTDDCERVYSRSHDRLIVAARLSLPTETSRVVRRRGR